MTEHDTSKATGSLNVYVHLQSTVRLHALGERKKDGKAEETTRGEGFKGGDWVMGWEYRDENKCDFSFRQRKATILCLVRHVWQPVTQGGYSTAG